MPAGDGKHSSKNVNQTSSYVSTETAEIPRIEETKETEEDDKYYDKIGGFKTFGKDIHINENDVAFLQDDDDILDNFKY